MNEWIIFFTGWIGISALWLYLDITIQRKINREKKTRVYEKSGGTIRKNHTA